MLANVNYLEVNDKIIRIYNSSARKNCRKVEMYREMQQAVSMHKRRHVAKKIRYILTFSSLSSYTVNGDYGGGLCLCLPFAWHFIMVI